MAIYDIVVDTNVLVHAGNEGDAHCSASRALVASLLRATTILLTDAGFSPDPSKNKSLIQAEYMKHLRAGSIGYELVSMLARTQRVISITLPNNQATKKAVIQMIGNTRDRTFLHVAIASTAKVLVSHDYIDFQVHKRGEIRKKFGVDVVEADTAEKLV